MPRNGCWTSLALIVNSLGFVLPTAATAQETAGETTYSASVRVTDTVLNTVKPAIFGDNIEWTNSGMGIWLPEDKKFDESLVELLRQAGVTHLRYPGGTLSDFFEWSKAIGDQRLPIPNPFSQPKKGEPEYPHFGPGEFMALCRRLNISATITLNAGTGTPEDAAGWVKYFRDQGFDVASYAVGNEIYMADKNEPVKELPIHKTPHEYVEFYLRCKAAIDAVVPGTRLGVIGLHDTGGIRLSKHPDWMPTVLGQLGDKIDFIDLHNGYAPAIRASGVGFFSRVYPDDEFAECFIGASVYVRDNIEQTKALIEQHAPNGGKNIELQVTEYGPLVYPIVPKRARGCGLEPIAVWCPVSGMFVQRVSGRAATHQCQPLATLSGCVRSADRRPWRLPATHKLRNIVYHVFQMYAGMQRREVLQTIVDAPKYSTRAIGIVPKLQDVPCVDAGAFRTSDGKRLSLFLINRSVKRAALTEIDPGFESFTVDKITVLAADSYKAENSPEQPDLVVPRVVAEQQNAQNRPFPLTLPRHSLTVIEFSQP